MEGVICDAFAKTENLKTFHWESLVNGTVSFETTTRNTITKIMHRNLRQTTLFS